MEAADIFRNCKSGIDRDYAIPLKAIIETMGNEIQNFLSKCLGVCHGTIEH